MASALDVRLFETSAGRRPVKEFLDVLPVAFRIQVTADIHLVATHGSKRPANE